MSKQQDLADMEVGLLENVFMGTSTAKILDFLMSYREFDYSEADIARYTKVSIRQVYRAIPMLESFGLAYQTRVSGRSKMYKLKTHSKAIQYLEKFVFELGVNAIPIQETLDRDEKEKLIVPQS